MKQVTKDEFFKRIGLQNVHPRTDQSTLSKPCSEWISIWETPNRAVIGKTVGSYPHTKFFL